MSKRAWSWTAVLVVATAAFLYGAVNEGPPRTNADRAYQLAQGFACPVCAGQSVAESDVSVAREIRRQIAVWVDEGRSDSYIRDQIVAVYGDETDYLPPASGLSSLVWILPLVAAGGIGTVLFTILRGVRGDSSDNATSKTLGETRAPVATGDNLSRRRRVVVWTAAILVFTTAAGVIVARCSGSRGVADSVTGEIRLGARELNFRALEAFNSGDIEEALALYDESLAQQPSNVEALTYRGWLTSRFGDPEDAVGYLEDAIASDPEYADARLFRAIVALDEGDAERAAAELEVFDSLDPSPTAMALVEQAQLRQRIVAAAGSEALLQVEAIYLAPNRVDFDNSGLTDEMLVAAAENKASQGCEGCLLSALQMLEWLLQAEPDNVGALAARGWLLARTGDAELVVLAVDYLDEAIEVDPSDPHALTYRMFALMAAGRLDAARGDLAAFDALADPPRDLVELIEAQGLREALDS